MKNLKEYFSGRKNAIVPILAAAAALMLFVSYFPNTDSVGKEKNTSDELAEYSAMLEEGLGQVLSEVVPDGKVKVFVTLESSYENVYATDAVVTEQTGQELSDVKSEKQIVLKGSGSESEALVVKRIPPKVKGAAIVCGGCDEYTKEKITNLAATALGVSASKIYVTGGN